MNVRFASWQGGLASLGRRFGAPLLTLVLLVGTMTHALAAATVAPAAPAAGTNQVSARPSEIPQSVFVIPNNPREGRNPFFPGATFGAPVPQQTRPTPVDTSAFVLNGITSPPKQTAMINGRTFELGEEGEVRLPSGAKELIKCVEIGADSAVIEVKGERRLLRFRSSP